MTAGKNSTPFSRGNFDWFNTKTSALEAGEAEKSAFWMLYMNHDGRSLCVQQVFSPTAGAGERWVKVA